MGITGVMLAIRSAHLNLADGDMGKTVNMGIRGENNSLQLL